MPSETLTVGHQCEVICPYCRGSGEGRFLEKCHACLGNGLLIDEGYVENEFVIEWEIEDYSDMDILDGCYECERCGQNMMEIILELL